jgi:transposase-like protein
MISKSWVQHWERVRPFFVFLGDICKAIYLTNAIESMCPAGAAKNMTLRMVAELVEARLYAIIAPSLPMNRR